MLVTALGKPVCGGCLSGFVCGQRGRPFAAAEGASLGVKRGNAPACEEDSIDSMGLWDR